MSLFRSIVKCLTEGDLSHMRKRPASADLLKPEEDTKGKDSATSLASFDEGAGRGTLLAEPIPFDNKQKLRQVKMKQLPSTSCFSSNHILVNRERIHRGVEPLVRCHHLDAMATKHANEMAAAQALQEPLHSVIMAENVQKGPSIKIIHQMIMVGISERERDNILSQRFAKFGMGTATGEDGVIYMSQVFQESAAAKATARRLT